MEKEKAYTICYRQTEYRSCTVFATSERGARKKFHAGTTQDDSFDNAENQRIIDVIEEAR